MEIDNVIEAVKKNKIQRVGKKMMMMAGTEGGDLGGQI